MDYLDATQSVVALIYMCEEPASVGPLRTSRTELHLFITVLSHYIDEKTAICSGSEFCQDHEE